MNKQEKKNFSVAIKCFKKEVLSSKKASQEFLVDLGIFTKKGNLRKPYKNLHLKQSL